MHRILAVLLAAFLVADLAGSAQARTDPEPAQARQGLLLRLGSPARVEAVEDLLLSVGTGDIDATQALAQALGHAGGRAALEGLGALLEHRDDSVRLTTLESVTRIDLRAEPIAARVRRIANEEKGAVCAAAATTLGHIGDGRDMDLLLTLALSEDDATQDAAYRAMARLTGANIPYVHARWAYYWKSFRRRAKLLLPQALVAVAIDAGATDSSALLDLVRQYAWVDVSSVRDHITEWLHEPDVPLRTVACKLTADLRLTDLGEEIEMALRFASRPELREEALRTLSALGVPTADE